MFRQWLFFFFFVSACLGLPAGAKRLTRGFKIAKMRLELPYNAEWEAPSVFGAEKVKDILSQPFHYLGKGAQCYAFETRDGQYVLKLFRFDQRQLFSGKSKNRRDRTERFFEGCKMAIVMTPEETGIVYLHLNQTVDALPVLHARGPLGQSFHLPLDRYRFALQKKAEPLAAGLFAAQKEGKLSERMEEIIALLESRIGKGIGNTDPSLWRNFGFLEDRAIEIDFGNYVPRPDFSERRSKQIELERYMRSLRSWVEKNAPESLDELNARVERARW